MGLRPRTPPPLLCLSRDDENIIMCMSIEMKLKFGIDQATKLLNNLYSDDGLGTIMMHNGQIKPIQDIQKGNELMGDDSEPRIVHSVIKRYGKMYRINNSNGQCYTFNDTHILSLYAPTFPIHQILANNIIQISCIHNNVICQIHFSADDEHEYEKAETFYQNVLSLNKTMLEIKIKDYLLLSPELRSELRCYRVGIDFTNIQSSLLYNKSYILGHDLGSSLLLYNHYSHLSNIPQCFKYGCREIRREFLAGVFDSQKEKNFLGKVDKIMLKYPIERYAFVNDVCFIIRSLGMKCTILEKKSEQHHQYILHIVLSNNNDHCHHHLDDSFTLTPLSPGYFHEIILRGNNPRYVLADFTVTCSLTHQLTDHSNYRLSIGL